MRDLLFFDNMLTPKIITFVYWLLLFAAIVGGLGAIIGDGGFFTGIMVAVFGAIGARIWCELMIVLFKINEALQEMRSK